MAVYSGNQVAYGSGGRFWVEVEVWDAGTTTGEATTVWYVYRIKSNYSLSDSSNVVQWTDPWSGGTQQGSANVQHGGSGGTTIFPGANPNAALGYLGYGYSNVLHFRFYAQGLAGVGGASVVEFDYPLPWRSVSLPGAPNLYVATITANSVHLHSSWTTTGGGTIDQVQYQLNNLADTVTVNMAYGGWGGVTLGGLVRGTGYRAYARAHNEAGWGPWAGPLIVTTSSTAPDAPAIPTTASVTQTSTTLNWVAPNNGGAALNGFHIQVDNDATFSSPVLDTTAAASVLTWGVNGLDLNTTYYARVRTWNANGYSGWSPVRTWTTSPGVPLAPTGVGVVGVTGVLATIAYAAAVARGSVVTAYHVQVDENPSFTSPELDVNNIPSGDRSRQATGLTPGTLYYARVRANSAVGWSDWSTVISFRTNAGFYITVGGVPKEAQLYVSVGGVPKLAELYVSVGGTPRLV